MSRARRLLIASVTLWVHQSLLSSVTWATEPISPTFADVEPQRDAEATFVANAYSLIHIGPLPRGSGDSSWRPSRGLVYRFSKTYGDFFLSLGRPDLASRVGSQRLQSNTLLIANYPVGIVGVLLLVDGLYKGSAALAITGGGLMVGATVMRIVGNDLKKTGFPEDEAQDMADRYNQALRRHLGLPVEETVPSQRRTADAHRHRFAFAPVLTPHAAAVIAGASF